MLKKPFFKGFPEAPRGTNLLPEKMIYYNVNKHSSPFPQFQQ